MQFSAIICEFNPLTNGHEYIIKKTKELGLPLLCIMSGSFVQRGEVAILDKYTRAKHAIMAGADMVIELPTIFALSPAQDFAFGAIKILNDLGCIKNLVFGSENGDIKKLTELANYLIENEQNSETIKQELKKGKSFSSCVSSSLPKKFENLLSSSNNVLAVEYIKALIKTNSKISPVTIKRENNYLSSNLSGLASATAVRQGVYEKNIAKIKNFVPEYVYNDLFSVEPERANHFCDMLMFSLRNSLSEEAQNISEATEGIEYRIIEKAKSNTSFNLFIKATTTKRYKVAKIRRIVIKNALKITKDQTEKAKINCLYAKLIAVSKESVSLLSNINKEMLITTKKDYQKLNNIQKEVIKKDLEATELSAYVHKTSGDLDYKIGMKIV